MLTAEQAFNITEEVYNRLATDEIVEKHINRINKAIRKCAPKGRYHIAHYLPKGGPHRLAVKIAKHLTQKGYSCNISGSYARPCIMISWR